MIEGKKGYIKKWVAALVGIPIAIGGVFVGARLTGSAVRCSTMSNSAQIEEIADEIGADLSVVNSTNKRKIFDNEYNRLKSNKDKPVYVNLGDELSEDQKQMCTDALDYVFDYLGKINSEYKYEVVDSKRVNSEFDKGNSVINFKHGNPNIVGTDGEIVKAKGRMVNYYDSFSTLLGKKANILNNVIFDNNYLTNDEYTNQDKLYTAIHEIMHSLGFNDVYTQENIKTTDKFCGDTFMLSSLGRKTLLLTPNDYACLLAMYAKPMKGEELSKYIAEAKVKIEKYKVNYYNAYAEISKEAMKEQHNCSFPLPVDFKDDRCYEFHFMDSELDENDVNHKFHYYVQVDNGKYKFAITDEGGNVLDKASGDAYCFDETVVLADVQLDKCLRPGVDPEYEGYSSTFTITDTLDSIYFYDLINDDMDIEQAHSNRTVTNSKATQKSSQK